MSRMITVPVDSGTPVRIQTSDVPAHTAEDLAQSIFEAIHIAYADSAIQQDYQKWKATKGKRRRARKERDAMSDNNLGAEP